MVRLSERTASLYDYFSFGLIARTFFAPFRQISAGRVQGPLGVQLRAFVDKLVSRFIGAMVRSAIVLTGIVAIGIGWLVGLVQIIIWPFLPIAPVGGILLALAGWVPWQ